MRGCMININLTEEVRNFAWDVVCKRNFGTRSLGANGSKEQQYTGIIGEAVIYNIIYDKFPDYSETRIVDVIINNKKIDIKTMGRTVYMKPEYVHNFIGYQKDFPNDIYIFNSIVKQDKVIQICGWLPKDEFFMKCEFYKKGDDRFRSDGSSFKTKAPLYEIKNKDLNAITTEEDLKKIGL